MSQWPGYDRVETYTAGADVDFDRDFTKVPANQRIVKAWLTIKSDVNDPDDAAFYQVAITIIPDANGNRIVADGATTTTDPDYGTTKVGTARLHWRLPRTLLVSLPQGPDLPYDVKLLASSGLYAPWEKGVIRIEAQTTQAT